MQLLRVSSCVITANRSLSEGLVKERVFSASARKDVVLKSLVCKLLPQTENQTHRNKEYLWTRSKREKCDFSASCRVRMHLTCAHSKQKTLQNFIANKKQDLSTF